MPKHTTKNTDSEYEKYMSDMHLRLNKIFDTEEKKISMMITTLGISAIMAEYLCTLMGSTDIPFQVLYAMTLTSSNMLAFTSGESEATIIDYSDDSSKGLSEQGEEMVYRKMIKIIKGLHKEIVKREKSGERFD